MSKKKGKSEIESEENKIMTEEAAAEVDTAAEETQPAEESPAVPEEAPVEEAAPAEEAPAEPEPQPAPAETPAPVVVEAGSEAIGVVLKEVAFRTGPSFNKAVISPLKLGAKVNIKGSEEGEKGLWYQCEYQGRTGYIKATGLRVE